MLPVARSIETAGLVDLGRYHSSTQLPGAKADDRRHRACRAGRPGAYPVRVGHDGLLLSVLRAAPVKRTDCRHADHEFVFFALETAERPSRSRV